MPHLIVSELTERDTRGSVGRSVILHTLCTKHEKDKNELNYRDPIDVTLCQE